MTPEELARRVHWQRDTAGELFFYDCSNNTRGDAPLLFEAFHHGLLSRPAGTVRVLADFENAVHAPSLTKMYKDAHAEHDRQVKKIACLGIHGGMKVVFAAYRFFVRLRGVDVDVKMRLFDDEAAARAWLLEE